MKNLLVGIFYTLQGIGNLTFALLLFISNPMFGYIIGILPFLTSILSLLAAVELFTRDKEMALRWGIASSILFILFYGLMAVNSWGFVSSSDWVMRQASGFHTIFLFLSAVIVELNIISIFLLYKSKKNKSI